LRSVAPPQQGHATGAGCTRRSRGRCAGKRLERGRFIWPSASTGVVTITAAQLGYLLEGIDWRMPQHTWRPQAAG
jgi:transposase